MDGKLGTFLLGVITAIVLYLLWKKEKGEGCNRLPSGAPVPQPEFLTGADSCCGTTMGPAGFTSPSVQAALGTVGLDGAVSPGAPPLGTPNTPGATGSFYSGSGPTQDTGFTFQTRIGRAVGSNTTPAAVTPTRALEAVPPHDTLGFVNWYNIQGVPKGYLQ